MVAAVTDPEPLSLPDVGGLVAGSADTDETLLFLHGWGGSKELWWNTLSQMDGGCRGIALDLPGVGGTPLPPELLTMADFARWIVGICDRLRLPPVTLVGHSLGGNLAAQTAFDFPGRVRRLVLVDAALEPSHFPRRARWPLSPRYGLLALRAVRWAAGPLAAWGRHVPHAHGGGYWRPYARRNHYYRAANTDAAMRVQLRALIENPLDPPRMAALSCPLLIAHGEHDGIIPVARARALAAALPGSTLAVFPNAHHCPMDSDPPAFARVLRDFLTRSGPRVTMGEGHDGPPQG